MMQIARNLLDRFYGRLLLALPMLIAALVLAG
jgi:hypothetical protein